MKSKREFEIAWQGLKLGEHVFEYELDDQFINEMDVEKIESIEQLKAKIVVTFDKHTSFFQLKFDVGGNVVVPCDRCGDDMTLTLWDEFDLTMKLVNEEDLENVEDEADIAFISRNDTVIDLSKWLYEYLMLSIPLHHIHPENEQGESECNPEALALLEKMREDHQQNSKNDLWKGLEKINIEQDKKKKK